jgi:predicted MPP superfamily phosphohydrolase
MTRFRMRDFPHEIDDYLSEILPKMNLLSVDSIPFDGTFIGVAGFEDRGFAFINNVPKLNKKFANTVGIEYRPFNNKNRINELRDKLFEISTNLTSWFIYDRFNPEKIANYFEKIKTSLLTTPNIIIDISSMSKFLVIAILDILKDFKGDIHIIYSEAEIYHPTKEEFEDRKKELHENIPIFLTKDVHRIVTTKALSSISMQGSPLAVIAFPTFNYRELIALLNELTPQYLIKIEGIPREEINSWRLDAVHRINSGISSYSFINLSEIAHRSVSTFDYLELIKNLDEIYKLIRYSHKLVVAPTGSKLQTFGVFIFKQMLPEIQIVYPMTKEFAEEYSEGAKNTWIISIPKFSEFIIQLNDHRKHNVKSLKEEIESPQNELYLLHISDIHIESKYEATKYGMQLKTDLIKNLEVKKLDYLAISGDIANFSLPSEYEAAVSLIQDIIKSFKVDPKCIILVPGNHDINWDLSKKAYSHILKSELPGGLAPRKSISTEDGEILVLDQNTHSRRFAYFSDNFYESILGEKYPLDYDQQGILYMDNSRKIVFLGLNSSWEIDHHKPHQTRSSINMEALSIALNKLMDDIYKQWFKIAVFHHPVSGPEMMKNVDFMQLLADHGFQICLNGHIHEANENLYKYFNDNIHIIGAGTFGAPKTEQIIGIPLQYNLIVLNTKTRKMVVETRKKDKPDGAWTADARWGNKNNPKPRYIKKLKK